MEPLRPVICFVLHSATVRAFSDFFKGATLEQHFFGNTRQSHTAFLFLLPSTTTGTKRLVFFTHRVIHYQKVQYRAQRIFPHNFCFVSTHQAFIKWVTKLMQWYKISSEENSMTHFKRLKGPVVSCWPHLIHWQKRSAILLMTIPDTHNQDYFCQGVFKRAPYSHYLGIIGIYRISSTRE